MRPIPEAPGAAHELRAFPLQVLSAGSELWRVHLDRNLDGSVRSPWFFGSKGRWGLDEPNGTCYLAFDAMTAICEARIRGQRHLSSDELDGYVIRTLSLPSDVMAADLTDAAAAGFGVSRAFCSDGSYDRTRAWAKAFYVADFRGIVYWPNFNVASDALSVAMFGSAGARDWSVGGKERLDDPAWRARIEARFGVKIVGYPDDDELRIK